MNRCSKHNTILNGNGECLPCGIEEGKFPTSTPHTVPLEWMREASVNFDLDQSFTSAFDYAEEYRKGSSWLICECVKIAENFARHSPGWVKIEEGKPETFEFAYWFVEWRFPNDNCKWQMVERSPFLTESAARLYIDAGLSRGYYEFRLVRLFREIPAPPSEGETRK